MNPGPQERCGSHCLEVRATCALPHLAMPRSKIVRHPGAGRGQGCLEGSWLTANGRWWAPLLRRRSGFPARPASKRRPGTGALQGCVGAPWWRDGNRKPVDRHSCRRFCHSPLTTHHSPLTTRHSPLATRHSPLATRHGSRERFSRAACCPGSSSRSWPGSRPVLPGVHETRWIPAFAGMTSSTRTGFLPATA
jgi:hypothetical protein